MLKKIFLFLIISFFLEVSFIQTVLAANAIEQFNSSAAATGGNAGYTITGDSINLPKRLGGLIAVAYLGALGIAFLGLTVYAGYIWMMARGNEQEVEKAVNTLKNAVIGLIIALTAYGIAAFANQFISQAGVVK